MDAVIVVGSAVFAVAFVLAWLTRPALRAWLEQPKHSLDASVRRYDQRAMSSFVRSTPQPTRASASDGHKEST
jgi:hypothetical protein